MALENPLFDASFRRIFGEGIALGGEADLFFERFYDHFLADASISRLFSEVDMQRLRPKCCVKSLMHVVAYPVIDAPSAELTRLAELHGRLGIPPNSFDGWLESLLKTVRETDPECDTATELAWCWAVTPALTFMRLHK